MTTARTALVAGSTGLVGSLLLPLLAADPAWGEVRAIARRALPWQHAKVQLLVSDYADLAALGPALAVDDVFCCLGTTLRAAGSRAAFERVDHGLVLELARATRAAGARRFLVVSAAGTTPRGNLYQRTKARMERDVSALGFDAVHIVRPSLLLGERPETRPGERLGQILSPLVTPLLRGAFAKYRPVAAQEVAAALVALARREAPGVHVHHLPLAAGT